MQKPDPGPYLNSFTAVLDKIGFNVSPRTCDAGYTGKTCRVCQTVVGTLLKSCERFRHLVIHLHNAENAQILLYK